MENIKKLTEEYQAQYEQSEKIPVTYSNYLKILLLVYTKRITKPIVLISVVVFIAAFGLIMFSKTNDFSSAFNVPILLALGLLIVLPPLWIGGTYIAAKRNDKHGFRKFDWMASFE